MLLSINVVFLLSVAKYFQLELSLILTSIKLIEWNEEAKSTARMDKTAEFAGSDQH